MAFGDNAFFFQDIGLQNFFDSLLTMECDDSIISVIVEKYSGGLRSAADLPYQSL